MARACSVSSLARNVACATIVVLGATWSASARADDAKVRCAAAYEQAQVLRRQDKLAASRSELTICEQTCPRALAADCTKWRGEVEALMPTVRLSARDANGHAVDARVLVDGTVLLEHLTDAPVPVDSGEHTFRFESPSGAAADVHAQLHGGERAKEIEAVFPVAQGTSTAPSQPHDGESGMPTASYVLGGIGIVGLGVGGALSIKGHLDASHLQSTCAPYCAPSDVNAISTLYTAGWISAGVGAAALVAALVVWRPWDRSTSTTAQSVFVVPAAFGAGAPTGFGASVGAPLP
jgi:hypothetical protein